MRLCKSVVCKLDQNAASMRADKQILRNVKMSNIRDSIKNFTNKP